MKLLYIVRHAKAQHDAETSKDFDRALTESGINDAYAMSKYLYAHADRPDILLTSSAKRTLQTAEIFAETFGKPVDEIIFISALYHAQPEVFYEVISALPDNLNAVAIFSHNPGINYFVNSLNTKVQVDNMPTCAIFAIEADITQWAGFSKAKKECLFFEYPRK